MRNIRETAAHLLAFAILKIFPNVELDGTHIDDDSLSCDLYLDTPIPTELFSQIETEMYQMAKQKPIFEICEMMRENAVELFEHLGQPYLAELTLEQPFNVVTVVRQGEQYNLAHETISEPVPGVYKILKNVEIDGRQRLYLLAATNQSELKKVIKQAEMARERDHRLIGKQLNLFAHTPKGLIWLPKGTFIKESFVKGLLHAFKKIGFQPVETPSQDPAEAFAIGLHSYKELPLKYIQNTQTAILTTPDECLKELISLLQFVAENSMMFDLECQYSLVRNRKRSKDEEWLVRALEHCSLGHEEERATDGPAIVVKIIDSIGRKHALWKISAKGVSHVRYHGPDDEMHEPVVINCSLTGTADRFIALLLEHFNGALPLWLTYEQVRIIPVKEKHQDYAAKVFEKLTAAGLRTHLDQRNDTLSARVHSAEHDNVPYIIVVGDQEELNGSIALRAPNGDVVKGVNVDTFIAQLQSEAGAKKTRKREGI